MLFIILYLQIHASDCITKDQANKIVRENQKLISELLYENEVLRGRVNEIRSNWIRSRWSSSKKRNQ